MAEASIRGGKITNDKLALPGAVDEMHRESHLVRIWHARFLDPILDRNAKIHLRRSGS